MATADPSPPTQAHPEIIYHYCSAASFLKIVESKSIRLSSIYYMNDAMEGFWLRQLAVEHIQGLADLDDVMRGHLEKVIGDQSRDSTFCACFSEDEDSLSQWQAYADDGRGFAIGFDPVHFDLTKPKERGASLQLTSVEYDVEQQRQIAKTALDRARRAFREPARNPGLQMMRQVFVPMVVRGQVWREAARCKHPSFSGEKEWRLVHRPVIGEDEGEFRVENALSALQFFERRGLLVPYISLPFRDPPAEPPIRRIVFGPKNRMPEQGPAVALLLGNSGYLKYGPLPELAQSQSSYR